MSIKLILLLSVFSVTIIGCSNDPIAEPTFEEQLKKDNAIIDSYLTGKAIIALTDPDNYGVKYKLILPGIGLKPTVDDSVTVNYTLKSLPAEQEIQKTSAPVKFLLGGLIPGWQIGLPLINEGAKATFYIPSGLGYGAFQNGGIPANSNLIYEIELVKVISQLRKDTLLINSFLAAKEISTLRDPSGLRYKIIESGTGVSPTDASTVSFNYTGKLINGLEEGPVFQKSTVPLEIKMLNIIRGLNIGLKYAKVGSKITYYIPSTLAYGFRGTSDGTIAPRANLIFEIELTAIK